MAGREGRRLAGKRQTPEPAPGSMQAASHPSPLPGWFFPAMAWAATVSAVWGLHMVACGGILASVVPTLATFCLHVFLRPDYALAVLLTAACSGATGLALARHRLFRERKELLFFLLPAAALVLGMGLAMSGGLPPHCPSLGAWR
ncbi:hypothetical protein [Roseateles flavus]|uniref:Membrane transporter protein n=1 Tax=Roseateles flavus TaxID=3149041 RepID=A0ABV0G862_9BURK